MNRLRPECFRFLPEANFNNLWPNYPEPLDEEAAARLWGIVERLWSKHEIETAQRTAEAKGFK